MLVAHLRVSSPGGRNPRAQGHNMGRRPRVECRNLVWVWVCVWVWVISISLCCVCHVYLYIGQNDLILSAPACENYLRTLTWNGASDFNNAQKIIWKIHPQDRQVAGYGNHWNIEIHIHISQRNITWQDISMTWFAQSSHTLYHSCHLFISIYWFLVLQAHQFTYVVVRDAGHLLPQVSDVHDMMGVCTW